MARVNPRAERCPATDVERRKQRNGRSTGREDTNMNGAIVCRVSSALVPTRRSGPWRFARMSRTNEWLRYE